MLRVHHIAVAAFLGTTLLLAACQSPTDVPAQPDPGGVAPPAPPAPPALDLFFTTDDLADRIEMITSPDPSVGSQLNICLEILTATGWWKGIGANRDEPSVQGDGNAVRCIPTAPGRINLTFWKAKLFGIHTKVGAGAVDLSRYAGQRALFVWEKE